MSSTGGRRRRPRAAGGAPAVPASLPLAIWALMRMHDPCSVRREPGRASTHNWAKLGASTSAWRGEEARDAARRCRASAGDPLNPGESGPGLPPREEPCRGPSVGGGRLRGAGWHRWIVGTAAGAQPVPPRPAAPRGETVPLPRCPAGLTRTVPRIPSTTPQRVGSRRRHRCGGRAGRAASRLHRLPRRIATVCSSLAETHRRGSALLTPWDQAAAARPLDALPPPPPLCRRPRRRRGPQQQQQQQPWCYPRRSASA